eukprot:gnl/MRDRNA2_/MRDRNA2_78520_c0_seq1.p1 gnl/MRDRNA2_/MRDRNA2_78520_c0~~gnl/MRDRNA2_/MRDRNA2_78520_c0_seq1.p1  ORF type:complete len:774 (+),score=140.16 gnl/MRDRNA2_/MRDRNA2_78520_c0_seq1:138-2459(+)
MLQGILVVSLTLSFQYGRCFVNAISARNRHVSELQPEGLSQQSSDSKVTILRWSAFGGNDLAFKCPKSLCHITSNRSTLSNASALYWSGAGDLMLKDMPATRPAGQVWALEMYESPCIYDLVQSSSLLSYFNIGIGMSPKADVQRCPYVPQKFLTELTAPAMPTAEKDGFRRQGTGLVAYIQGNCVPKRDELVEALEAEGIEVDALGECRHNRDLPMGLDRRSTLDSAKFLGFERRYKFAIALENCECHDYVTEKLYRRLHEGVVPIYVSGNNGWLPDPKAIIDPYKFASVRELAQELRRLDANSTAYEEHLAWKRRNFEHTELAQRLKRCSNTYKPQATKKEDNEVDWCPICDEVQRQRADLSSVSSLADNPPFGVCQHGKSSMFKSPSELDEFLKNKTGASLKFNNHNSSRMAMPVKSPLEQPMPASLEMWKKLHGPWMKAEAAQGFPSRPSPSTWKERLRYSVEAASSKPCSAEVLLGAFDWPFGFGSRFNNVVNGIWIAMYQNLSMAVCDSPWADAVWEKHFENAVNIPVCKSCPSSFAMQEAFVMPCFGGGPAKQLADVDRTYITDFKRFIYDSIFKYNEYTKTVVQERVRALNLDQGTRYLGVHVRHGDKGQETALVPVEKYAAQAQTFLAGKKSSLALYQQNDSLDLHKLAGDVRQELDKTPTGLRVVFVASDDSTIRQQLQQQLGSEVDVREQPRLDVASYNFSAVGQNEAATLNLLTDIEILRSAEVFISTASSNLARLVFFLRDSKHRSISLDDQGDFLHTPC